MITPQEHLQQAKEGKTFMNILLPNNRFKIMQSDEDSFLLEVISRLDKKTTTGCGETDIIQFTRWFERERLMRLERCFLNGEYVICDELDHQKFTAL